MTVGALNTLLRNQYPYRVLRVGFYSSQLLESFAQTAKSIDAVRFHVSKCRAGEALGNWVVSTNSSKWVLTDVLAKTGSLLLRRSFVDRLKARAANRQLDFTILSPNGIRKIPVYYIVVRVKSPENSGIVQGLLEYAYGALRLAAVDDEELAGQDGAAIVAFFEALLSEEWQDIKVELIEPIPAK